MEINWIFKNVNQIGIYNYGKRIKKRGIKRWLDEHSKDLFHEI
jgi:hypothetical protein